MTMSAYDFLSQWFETDPLKATMAASGIIGTFQGVKSPGTAYVLLHHYMGEIDGAFRAWGIPKGGTGGISNAIASAARANGAEIRTEAPVARIQVGGGRATGVVLESGEELEAASILSSVDVRRTFIDLVEPGSIDDEFEAEVRRFKFRGSSGKVNMALDSLPSFTALPGEGEHLRGAISISPSVDDMERAYDDAKYGRFSAQPYIDIVIPTLVDPSMAPPGKHVMSCFVQYAPYNLDPSLGALGRPARGVRRRGRQPDRRVRAGPALEDPPPPGDDAARHRADDGPDRGQHLPGRALARAAVLQPAGAGLGPLPDADQDLWLCGSSTHPGGGIMGANGRIAALELLRSKGTPLVTGPRPDPAWDAVVIGGGHNALVTAAYLAKGGMRTLVLERRDRVGGAADTTQLAKGIRVPTLAHTVGRLRPSVQKDLRLSRHGLSLVAPDVRVFAPSAGRQRGDALDGRLEDRRGPPRRTRSTTRTNTRSSTSAIRAIGRFLDDLGRTTPPDIKSPGLGDAISGLRLGKSFKGLGRDGSRTVLRVLPMAIADLVAESFENDAVRAALAWRGVRYGAVGPWSAGTAAMLLGDAAGNDGGAAGETVFARGGPGALAEALAAAAREAGVDDSHVRGGHADHLPRRPGDRRRARGRRGDPGRRRRLGRSTRSARSSTSSTRWRSGRRSAGAPATSGRRASWPRSTSRSGSCRSSRPPAATRRSSAAGSSSRPGSTPWSAPSTPRSTAAGASTRSSRRRSRRSPTRRWSRARRPARTS